MFFEETAEWRAEWDRVSHLVSRLIEALSEMATAGVCSRISKNMAYTLFTNVVDYADKYRGMDMVVLHEYEAYADISLAPETYGNWHIPLHWIDSVSHLAGLVMNASDVSNTKNFFYLNPGFGTLRFIGPFRLLRSIAITDGGDLYIIHDDIVVGMLGQIKSSAF
ncbi:hypothetical protein N7463_003723 [Penicillium fimorum]|uniref:Uncharacterized protein n=1 Tax=Penicillium fimorum TaxID=1882269 RepID=A0A9W9Y1H3_9EURO|nr:hypothetical protein N7463_003723 [Penicillium fimorum]